MERRSGGTTNSGLALDPSGSALVGVLEGVSEGVFEGVCEGEGGCCRARAVACRSMKGTEWMGAWMAPPVRKDRVSPAEGVVGMKRGGGVC
jgi:hypothetical protein